MNEHHRRPLFIVSLIYELLPLIFDSYRDSGHAGTKVARYYETKKEKIYRLSYKISPSSFNFVENNVSRVTIGFGFPTWNLLEQRERISVLEKLKSFDQWDDRRLSRDNIRVVAYAACRLSSNLSSL